MKLLKLNAVDFDLKRYYGTMIPTTLNLATLVGYCILNSIVSGQALSSISNDHLSWRFGSFHYVDLWGVLTLCAALE